MKWAARVKKWFFAAGRRLWPFVRRKKYAQLFQSSQAQLYRLEEKIEELAGIVDQSEYEKLDMQRRMTELLHGIEHVNQRHGKIAVVKRLLQTAPRSLVFPVLAMTIPRVSTQEQVPYNTLRNVRVDLQTLQVTVDLGLSPDTPPEFVAEDAAREVAGHVQTFVLTHYRKQSILKT